MRIFFFFEIPCDILCNLMRLFNPSSRSGPCISIIYRLNRSHLESKDNLRRIQGVNLFPFFQLCVILEPMQELMSRHKAYALSPRDCLKTTLFQKWQRMVAPPGKRGRRTVALHENHQPVEPVSKPVCYGFHSRIDFKDIDFFMWPSFLSPQTRLRCLVPTLLCQLWKMVPVPQNVKYF